MAKKQSTGNPNGYTGIPYSSNRNLVNPLYFNNQATVDDSEGNHYPITEYLSLDPGNNLIEVMYDNNGTPVREWIKAAPSFWNRETPSQSNQEFPGITGEEVEVIGDASKSPQLSADGQPMLSFERRSELQPIVDFNLATEGMNFAQKRAYLDNLKYQQMRQARGLDAPYMGGQLPSMQQLNEAYHRGELTPAQRYHRDLQKSTAKDIDKVMLGTLGIGVAPFAAMEALPALGTLATGTSDAIMSTGVGQAIGKGIATYGPAVLTAMGAPIAYNAITSPEGIQKTNRMWDIFTQNPDWYNFVNYAKSGLGDVMDISMAAPLIKPLSVAGRGAWDAGKELLNPSWQWLGKQITAPQRAARIRRLQQDFARRAKDLKTRADATLDESAEYRNAIARDELEKVNDGNAFFVENEEGTALIPLDESLNYTGKHESSLGTSINQGNYKWPNYSSGEIQTGYMESPVFNPIAEYTVAPKEETGYLSLFSGLNKRKVSEFPDTEAITIIDHPFTETSRRIVSGNLTGKDVGMPELQNIVDNNIKYLEEYVPGFKPLGSSVGVRAGAIKSIPHDIDGYITKAQFDQFKAAHPEASIRAKNAENTTYELTLNPEWGDAGVVDLNIVDVSPTGVGNRRAMQLYQQYFPDEYSNMTRRLSTEAELTKDKNFWKEFPLLDMEGNPISAEQLLERYDPEVGTILDSFTANFKLQNKGKHAGRSIYYMTGDRPDLVHRALQQYSDMLVGGRGKGRLFPKLEFGTTKENEELLKSINFAGDIETAAKDPAKMQNILDAWYLTEGGVFGRTSGAIPYGGQGHIGTLEQIRKNFSEWLFKGTGRHYSGYGQNWIAGTESGLGQDLLGMLQPEIKGLHDGMAAKDAVLTTKRAMLHPDYKITKDEANAIKEIYQKHDIFSTDFVKEGITGPELMEKSPKEGEKIYEANKEIAELLGVNFATGQPYSGNNGEMPFYTGSLRNFEYSGLNFNEGKDLLGLGRYDGAGRREIARSWKDRMAQVNSGLMETNPNLRHYFVDSNKITLPFVDRVNGRLEEVNQFFKTQRNNMRKEANRLENTGYRYREALGKYDRNNRAIRQAAGIAGLTAGVGAAFGIPIYLTSASNEVAEQFINNNMSYFNSLDPDESAAFQNFIWERPEIAERIINGETTLERMQQSRRYQRYREKLEKEGWFGDNAKALGGPLFTPRNLYAGGGPKRTYKAWKKAIQQHKGINIDEDDSYDYRSYYINNTNDAWDMLNKDSKAHFIDAYKRPSHSTYSDQSIYSHPPYIQGGHWEYNKRFPNLMGQQWNYQLSPTQVDSGWDYQDTMDYAIDAENDGFYVTDSQGRYPIVDGTVEGGVLPNVDVGPTYYPEKQYAEGGSLNTPKPWDELSIKEKAEMMKVAVSHGLTSLADIKDKYNELMVGGNLYARGGRAGRRGGSANRGYNAAVQRAMNYFMGKGLTRYQAAGLVGNLMRESSLQIGAVNPKSGAYGIAQWLGDRKKKLFEMYGPNPTLDQQLDYTWYELNTTHRNGLRHLKNSKDAAEAARNAFGYYEFSAGPEGALAAMNKTGQNGTASLNRGIQFASNIMGIPYTPYEEPKLEQEADLQLDLSNVPFEPWNPYEGLPLQSGISEEEKARLAAQEAYYEKMQAAMERQQIEADRKNRLNFLGNLINYASNAGQGGSSTEGIGERALNPFTTFLT